jgi:hypothetical protein
MRTSTPTWQSPAAQSQRWAYLALFVPLGYAVSRAFGPDLPLPALLALAVSAACLHRLMPAVVETVAGAVALVAGVLAAAEDRAFGRSLGRATTGVLLLFGGVMVVSAFVRLLGSASGREMAKHLVAAAAALEIGLLVLSPVGRSVVSPEGDVAPAAVLAVVLLTATVVGIRSRFGFPLLGLGVLATEVVLALTGAPSVAHPGRTLLACIAFTAAALWLHDADRVGVVHRGWPDGDDDRLWEAA